MRSHSHVRPWHLGATLVAGAIIWFAAFAKPTQEQTLADGTVLRLEHVGYGTNQSYTPTPAWKLKLVDVLPEGLRGKFSFIGSESKSSSDPVLFLWFSRHDPLDRDWRDNPWADEGVAAELVDGQGRVCGGRWGLKLMNIAMPAGATFKLTPQLHDFTFREFPGKEPSLRVRLKEGKVILAEFEFKNPAVGIPGAGEPGTNRVRVRPRDL